VPVETGRPGVPGIIDDPRTHEDVVPTAVFRQNGLAHTDDTMFPHGLQVASVMISKDDGQLAGVAPDALLYASAFGAESLSPDDLMKTIQHVASRNGGDIRAINHSYGVQPLGLESPDGNSYLTMGIDWSASAHNVLHVVSGENFEANPLPKDNYNGMTIAASRRDSGVFREVDPDINNYIDAINAGRVWIDLLAPGRDIDVAGFNSSTIPNADGTSLAAPHVTGTVALL
jgi:subtilisin family serine protease